MKRFFLLLVIIVGAGAVSACKQQKAQDLIIQYCQDRPDEGGRTPDPGPVSQRTEARRMDDAPPLHGAESGRRPGTL